MVPRNVSPALLIAADIWKRVWLMVTNSRSESCLPFPLQEVRFFLSFFLPCTGWWWWWWLLQVVHWPANARPCAILTRTSICKYTLKDHSNNCFTFHDCCILFKTTHLSSPTEMRFSGMSITITLLMRDTRATPVNLTTQEQETFQV